MKSALLISAGLLVASICFTAQASTDDHYYIAPALEAKLIKVCEAVMSDKRLQLHLRLKEYRLSAREINKGLKCNGEDPYNFAMTHQAYTNANYLNRGRVKIRDIANAPVSVSVNVGE